MKTLKDCCDELAVLVQNEEHKEFHKGSYILDFIESINNGETPAMALSLAKNARNLDYSAHIETRGGE